MVLGRVRNLARSFRLAAALAATLLAPAAARADCGKHDRPIVPARLACPPGGDAVSPDRWEADPAPAEPPRPCTGPSCSRPPARPAEASAPDRVPPEPALGTPRADTPRPGDGRRVAVGPDPGYAAPWSAPVDRPPRP